MRTLALAEVGTVFGGTREDILGDYDPQTFTLASLLNFSGIALGGMVGGFASFIYGDTLTMILYGAALGGFSTNSTIFFKGMYHS